MAEKHEQALVYSYTNMFFKKLRDLRIYIKFLGEIERRLDRCNWNEYEKRKAARELFERYRKLMGRAPNQGEIQGILAAKETLRKFIDSLISVLWKIQKIQLVIYTWNRICRIGFSVIPVIKDIQNTAKNRKKYRLSANEMINAVKDAKNAMKNLIEFLEELNHLSSIPIAGLIINGYLQFFKAMDGVFGKVENYARRIINECSRIDSDKLGSVIGTRNMIFRNPDYFSKR